MTEPGSARVLVVDDDRAMELAVLAALSAIGVPAPRCARTVRDAERLAAAHAFDLAVVDLGLPDGSGLTLLRAWSERHPDMVCVAHTVFGDDATLFAALAAGAQGYLLKGQHEGLLAAQLAAALRGEPPISPAIARRVLASFRDGRPADDPPAHDLTAREAEVLGLVARGLTLPEVAERLGLSINTVRGYTKGAYAKLGVRTRAAAALEARRLGLVDGA